MPGNVEHFNVALPDGLPLKDFMHWHGCNVTSGALVKVLHCHL